MQFGKIEVPRPLIEARREGRLVVFAGAGVSMGPPAGRKSFQGIANRIEEQTGIDRGDVSIEKYLGQLENQGVPVHRMTREILTEGDAQPTDLHHSLLKLFGNAENVRIITTNFDLLFSDAAEKIGWNVPVYQAPALPQGDQFDGVVHVHGSFRQPDDQLVLTDKDFSEAYLTEGWARRFLQQLFSEYVVLFVGYSHGDDVMRYLARGIPAETSQRRFAFDRAWGQEDETMDRERFWNFYGVDVQLYPKGPESEHEELPKALREWTEFANERPSDRERRVQDLLSQSPDSLSEWEEEYLRQTLKTPEGTRYVTRHAETFEWVQWLDTEGVLDPLFDQGDLNIKHKELAVWIANFLGERSEKVLGLVSDKWTGLNPNLAREICHRLYTNRKEGKIEEETLVKWILVVLDETQTFPEVIVEVFRESIYPDDTKLIKVLLNRATELTLDIHEFPAFDEDDNSTRILSELKFPGGTPQSLKHTIMEVWNATIQPNLDEFGPFAESLITTRLQEASDVFAAAGARWEQYADSITWRWRKPNDSSGHDDVDCLVSMAFDLIDWLIENQPDKALVLINRWGNTDAPILNLLAVHGLNETDLLSGDEKIKRVLEEGWLLDPGLHERSSHVVDSAWSSSQRDTPKEVTEYLLDHLSLEDEEEKKYFWFQIRDLVENLEKEDEANAVLQPVSQALVDIRDDADDDLFTNDGANQEETTKFADLDLESDLDFILDRFTSLDKRWEKRDAEEDLERETRKRPEWTLDLAKKLAEEKQWEAAIWPYIFTAWRRVNQSQEVWNHLLSFLRSHTALHERYSPQIAHLLKKQGNNKHGAIPDDCLDAAIELAETIWDYVISIEPDDEEASTLRHRLQRHPITNLVRFYEEAYFQRGENHVPQAFREKIERLAETTSIAAQAGIYQLMGWATWIHVNDPSWSRKFLISLLSWNNESLSAAAWIGVLENVGLQNALIVDLADEFKATFRHLDVFEEKTLKSLVEKTAHASFHRLIDPMHEAWIDQFLKQATEEQACHFAQQIRTLLYRSDTAQIDRAWEDWLKEYVKRRRDNLPTPLKAEERKKIIDWFSQLGSSFPEAVNAFTPQLSNELDLEPQFHVFRELAQEEFGSDYPQPTCDFLQYLITDRASVPRMHRRHVGNLIKQIANAKGDADGLEEVTEEAIRLGCITAEKKQEWLSLQSTGEGKSS